MSISLLTQFFVTHWQSVVPAVELFVHSHDLILKYRQQTSCKYICMKKSQVQFTKFFTFFLYILYQRQPFPEVQTIPAKEEYSCKVKWLTIIRYVQVIKIHFHMQLFKQVFLLKVQFLISCLIWFHSHSQQFDSFILIVGYLKDSFRYQP